MKARKELNERNLNKPIESDKSTTKDVFSIVLKDVLILNIDPFL
jgi:hypothetical protein